MPYLIPLPGGVLLLDPEDYRRFGEMSWRVTKGGAQWTYKDPPRTVWLHREIMGLVPGDGLEVDHINRNRLDNRRSNLRVVTHAQNMHNRPVYRNSSSGLRGVSWSAAHDKWRARVRVNGNRVHLGYFHDKHEAAEAAREARLRLMSHAHD